MNRKVTFSHMSKLFNLTILLVVILLSHEAYCNSKIYNESKYSKWLPITYILNGTFDVAQNDNWFNQSDFDKKNKVVWKRVRSPIKNIEKDGGHTRFIKDELLSDRAVPNILLHTVGGAYDGLWLTEYYDQNGASYPYLLAILTSYAARWGNEVLEAGNENISSHDHIADLFFFDSLGLAISKNEKIMNYFIQDLGMEAWHSIPFYDPEEEDFFNSGLNYILRPDSIRFTENLRPFFYFGMQNIVGISLYSNQNTFSLGSGVFLTDPLKRKMRIVTSFFYEKNRSLALSAFVNGSEGFRWRFNLYPRLLEISKNIKMSVLVGEKRNLYASDFSLGLNINMPFGLGIN